MRSTHRPLTRRLLLGVVAGLVWGAGGAWAPLVTLPRAEAGPFGVAAVSGMAREASSSRAAGRGADSPGFSPDVGAARYEAPLDGPLRVLHPFVAPVNRYSAGHRGVDLASVEAQSVRAAARGQVTFAGVVAGRGVVVIAHVDGVRTEYEPVAAVVTRGDLVAAGEQIGTVAGAHSDCGDGGCLHWAASANGGYLDPMSLLRPLGIVRLVPSE